MQKSINDLYSNVVIQIEKTLKKKMFMPDCFLISKIRNFF